MAGVGHRPDLVAFAERLAARELLGTIGALNGDAEYVFGLIWDAHVTEHDEVLILDRQAAEVRAFDLSGTFLHAFGGRGEGPGELGSGQALIEGGPSGADLVVVDQERGLQLFRRGPEGYEYFDQFDPPLSVYSYGYDACAIEGRVVVHGANLERPEVLYSFGDDGRVQARFAATYRWNNYLAREALSRGRVTCVPSAGLVVLAFMHRGVLEAYDVESRVLVWNSLLEGVQPAGVVELDAGARIRSGILDDDFVHVQERLVGGDGTPIVAQYSRWLRQDVIDQTGEHVLETFVIDPITGNGHYWSDELPRIVWLSDEYVLTLLPDPFPRVQVFRY